MAVALIILGLALLTVGGDCLVRGATRLAKTVGLPSLVIGLTVVAYGTSAPECAVSIKAGLDHQPDIAMGNVLGSNIFNVLCILGLTALILPLTVSAQLVRLDVPVMIGVSGLAWLMASDGVIARGEGAVLCLVLIAYTALLVHIGKRSRVPNEPSNQASAPACGTSHLIVAALWILLGLVLLVLGSRWLVQGAVDVARMLGVSELMIGLTIVAAGTSMPEAATSIVAGMRGERDIAVGNIVGSNIFNLLGVLGGSALVAADGLAVAPAALRFDIPVMTAVALVCLPICLTGGRISRSEGALFLGYYVAYVVFIVLADTKNAALPAFSIAMLWYAVPLSVLGLGISLTLWLRTLCRLSPP